MFSRHDQLVEDGFVDCGRVYVNRGGAVPMSRLLREVVVYQKMCSSEGPSTVLGVYGFPEFRNPPTNIKGYTRNRNIRKPHKKTRLTIYEPLGTHHKRWLL